MATSKNLLLNIFFPSSPNDLKLLQYFFDLYRKVCGIFWLDTYIFKYQKVMLNFGLPYGKCRQKQAQNWHIYNKKNFFSSIHWENEFGLEVISQGELLHWGTGRYFMNWIQVVYFILKEIWPLFSTAKDKKLGSFSSSLPPNLLMKVWNQVSVKRLLKSTTSLRNWIRVVYFKLKEIWPQFSTAKDKKPSSLKAFEWNLSQKALKLASNDNYFTEELNASCLFQTERDLTPIFPC